ncbi:MAG: asparagine synthase-related protein, partial [Bdellovibrionota bacterium]
NEADHAKAVAKHLGTEHTELYVSGQDTLAVVPLLPKIYDEPFADSSQIPTYLVSKLAREKVTVALSGDGGDEVFGGYLRHLISEDPSWKSLKRVPAPLRRGAGSAIRGLSPAVLETLLQASRPFMPKGLSGKLTLERLLKGAELLAVESPMDAYLSLNRRWSPDLLLEKGLGQGQWTALLRSLSEVPNPATQMMLLDTMTYLPNDILVKVDRAAMAVSLETRAPFLDHTIFEFAHSLPLEMKIHGGQGKVILRKLLDRYVPRGLVDRPKMGFGVPIVDWLRGPLKEWSSDLLSPERLRASGIFEVAQVQKKLQEHQSGAKNWQFYLWDILMYQAWLEESKNG